MIVSGYLFKDFAPQTFLATVDMSERSSLHRENALQPMKG